MAPQKFKNTKQDQQKKIVTSALLKISLKVDKYLYTKEQIPLQKAKDFINEIAKLKIERNDLRSCQVSDKLNSILKSVINEYPNEATDTENSNTFTLNTNVQDKLNENFETKSDEALKIGYATGEASVDATNAVESQNSIIESVNMEDQIDINNNTSIPIQNMSKDFQKEGMLVNRNKATSENISLNIPPIVETCIKNRECNIIIDNSTNRATNEEILNNRNVKVTNRKSITIKKKTPCSNESQTKTKMKSINNTKNSKDNIKVSSTNKKRKSKKKQIVDLTWIENIKFVREIDTEEHVVSNLKESFWSNLTMPANCSPDFETD